MSVAKRQLKSNVLKRALNAFLVEPFIIKYNVISVRVLLEQGVDWPDYALSSIETEITKKMFSLGMNIKTCKAIKPRGKKIIPPIRKFIKILQLYIVYIYYDVVYCIYLL